MADAPRELKAGPPAPFWRQAAGGLGRAAQGAAEFLESAPPALRPAAFLPWFLLNLPQVARAGENLEQYGLRERYSSPSEVEAGAPTLRTPASDLAQIAFGLGGVQPTAQLARGVARLPGAALNELASVGPRAAQRGAVKLPGGSFDWPTFQELKSAFRESNPDLEARLWIDQAVKAYAQKFLGTTRDPLRELPVGGQGTWENMTDRALAPISARNSLTAVDARLARTPDPTKDRPNEPMWGLGYSHTPPGPLPENYPFKLNQDLAGAREAKRAMEEEFRRTGEWAHENLAPGDLMKKYDLPRLVLERSQHEAKLRHEAKLAGESRLKDFPPVKEYPEEGLRWVEMEAPIRLTPEQAKTVRKATREERGLRFEDIDPDMMEMMKGLDKLEVWRPLDHRGKPIMMKPEGGGKPVPVMGDSPQEAWFAGRLAEEGNLLGNCVGQYCGDVIAGNKRIFSLRDSKGGSHAVVEVQRPNPFGPATTADEIEDYLPSDIDFKSLRREFQHGSGGTDMTMAQWIMDYRPDIVKRLIPHEYEMVQAEGKGHRYPTGYQKYLDDLEHTLGFRQVQERGD